MWQCAACSGLLHTSGASNDYGAMFEWLSTRKNRRNSQQQLLIYVLQISHEVNWNWTWGSWWEDRILSPEFWHDHSLYHMLLNHVHHPENDLWNKGSIKSHVFYIFVDRTLPMETAQAIKVCRMKGGKLHSFLSSTLDEGEWWIYGLSRFSPQGKTTGTDQMGGWVAPRAGQDALEERKSLPPARIWTPDHPVLSLVAVPTALAQLNINALILKLCKFIDKVQTCVTLQKKWCSVRMSFTQVITKRGCLVD